MSKNPRSARPSTATAFLNFIVCAAGAAATFKFACWGLEVPNVTQLVVYGFGLFGGAVGAYLGVPYRPG